MDWVKQGDGLSWLLRSSVRGVDGLVVEYDYPFGWGLYQKTGGKLLKVPCAGIRPTAAECKSEAERLMGSQEVAMRSRKEREEQSKAAARREGVKAFGNFG